MCSPLRPPRQQRACSPFQERPKKMKTIRILLLALLASAAFVCPRAQAQIGQITNPVSAPLYAQDAGTCSATANSNLIQQLPPNASTTTVNLSGTLSATVTVRASNNGGATWVTLGTASAAGTTTYGTNSYTHLCADVTTYTSGTVNVTISTGVIGGGNGNSGSLSLPTTLTAAGVFTISPACGAQANCLQWVDDDSTDNCGTATTNFLALINAYAGPGIPQLFIEGASYGPGLA